MFVRALLDVWVVALLVLSRFVVHLLQPVALGVRVWSGSRRPVDVVDLGECPLCVFDCPDDFAVLVSGTAEANGHSLAVEPRQDPGENCVDGTERGESNARTLLVGGKTCQGCCDEDLQEVEEGDDVVRHSVQDAVLQVLAEGPVVEAAIAPSFGGCFGGHEDVM